MELLLAGQGDFFWNSAVRFVSHWHFVGSQISKVCIEDQAYVIDMRHAHGFSVISWSHVPHVWAHPVYDQPVAEGLASQLVTAEATGETKPSCFTVASDY